MNRTQLRKLLAQLPTGRSSEAVRERNNGLMELANQLFDDGLSRNEVAKRLNISPVKVTVLGYWDWAENGDHDYDFPVDATPKNAYRLREDDGLSWGKIAALMDRVSEPKVKKLYEEVKGESHHLSDIGGGGRRPNDYEAMLYKPASDDAPAPAVQPDEDPDDASIPDFDAQAMIGKPLTRRDSRGVERTISKVQDVELLGEGQIKIKRSGKWTRAIDITDLVL